MFRNQNSHRRQCSSLLFWHLSTRKRLTRCRTALSTEPPSALSAEVCSGEWRLKDSLVKVSCLSFNCGFKCFNLIGDRQIKYRISYVSCKVSSALCNACSLFRAVALMDGGVHMDLKCVLLDNTLNSSLYAHGWIKSPTPSVHTFLVIPIVI